MHGDEDKCVPWQDGSVEQTTHRGGISFCRAETMTKNCFPATGGQSHRVWATKAMNDTWDGHMMWF